MGVFFRVAFFVVIGGDKVKVNGLEKDVEIGITLKQYLLNEGYKIIRIVVEINGTIIPKSDYENVLLNKNDLVEILNFVGGG